MQINFSLPVNIYIRYSKNQVVFFQYFLKQNDYKRVHKLLSDNLIKIHQIKLYLHTLKRHTLKPQ